jgi:hypothetical protein
MQRTYTTANMVTNIIKRNGCYFISEKTLTEINEGAEVHYGLKRIVIHPCSISFYEWLESGYMITDCHIKGHKKIISIK